MIPRSREGIQCIFIPAPFCWLSLPLWPAHCSKLHFSPCHRRPGPLLLNLPLCPPLQTSAVSNLALWPTLPLPIYLHISPIAYEPLSFPSLPRSKTTLSIFSCCSPPYQLPSLPLSPLSFSLVFSIYTAPVPHLLIFSLHFTEWMTFFESFCHSQGVYAAGSVFLLVSRKTSDQIWMKLGGKSDMMWLGLVQGFPANYYNEGAPPRLY